MFELSIYINTHTHEIKRVVYICMYVCGIGKAIWEIYNVDQCYVRLSEYYAAIKISKVMTI